MRIIVDARSFNHGGIGALLLDILENLDYGKNEYAIIGDRSELEPLKLPAKIIHSKTPHHSIIGFVDYNLAKIINSYDCYLTPNYFIPRAVKINSYFIIHDMLFVDMTDINHRPITDYVKRLIVKRSYKVATKAFATSEFTLRRAKEFFGDDKKIELIRPGMSNLFKDVAHKQTEVHRKKYYVYVGNAKPHKNLDVLIKAFEKIEWKYPLHIIVQRKSIRAYDRKALKRLARNPNITILYNLSPEQYVREISEAKALINPSMYEGFGSQVLEATYCKTPVIISDIQIFRELFNDFKVYFFDPHDVNQLADILLRDDFENTSIPESFKKEHDNKIMTKHIEEKFKEHKEKQNTKKNFVFNLIYQLLVVITPLITAPYVARVLGADNIGSFAFSYTIICYFVIFAYIGFQQYAQRAIAEVQNDKEEQSRVFWQIVILRLIPVVLSIGALFVLYALGVFGEYSSLVLYFSILVGATAFDINFYFHGKENFFIVMIINLLIRLVYLILIFTMVKTVNDVWIYALLYSLMVAGGYLSMWVMLPANLRRVKLNGLNFKKHMKSSAALFIPVAAVSIYALLDKTLIGALIHGEMYVMDPSWSFVRKALISEVENGYYFQAERIIKALLSILLAYGMVMTTRNAIEHSNNRNGAIKKNVYSAFRFVFASAIPMILGMIIVAKPFSNLYFGTSYDYYTEFSIDGVTSLLMLYAPVILLSGISNILGAQYLLPTKQDKKYAISVGTGFVVNLGLNLLLIPFMGAAGAVVGTLISEFTILMVQYMFVRKDFSLKIILLGIWKYLIAGGIMFLILFLTNTFILSNLQASNALVLILLIPSGALIYYFTLLLLKEHEVFRFTRQYIHGIKSFLKSATSRVVLTNNSNLIVDSNTKSNNQLKNKEITNDRAKE